MSDYILCVNEYMAMACFAAATSCTRNMFAPRSNAIVFAAIVAGSTSDGPTPNGLYNMDLREIPTNIGACNADNTSN